MIYLFIIILKW